MSSSVDVVLDSNARSIHLNGDCQIFSLGSVLDPARINLGDHRPRVVSVLSPADIRRRRLNPALDAFEERSVLRLTVENERVHRHARARRLLSTTVFAYIHCGETVVGFGEGGSESMTIFVRKDGEAGITVRKILSEALTTARWDPDGVGVMLPPFAKAHRQAQYLHALPPSVREFFPAVHDVIERDIPIPPRGRTTVWASHREVIYEMSYVPGEEVSRYVARCSPPPAVIARLYEQIHRLLHEKVHSFGRTPAPGPTVDVSYLRKIEDRLGLCRATAPMTFGPDLLDSERIVINGVSYLNSSTLLARFRSRPDFLRVLEPRFHSLVMGDTNTENIKLTDTTPLENARRLIEAGASRDAIDRALAAITYESTGITFLDPRAIGFQGEGGETRDDPMYDNKPWHNSIGHYDEIHAEHFSMRVRGGPTPQVDIEFVPGNPYQAAYRVRDVTVHGEAVDESAPRGMEDYFKRVMTDVYDLGNPESPCLRDDPYWLIRFVFIMGAHFTAMPPFHFHAEMNGTLRDTYHAQRRPVAIYCEGVKWLNWALEMLEGTRTEFLGIRVPSLP
ncbi:hypothetical protein [Actinoplanes subtropicus]|uniref:hypothetical protein n=1 Tax=Actinoplanes subtropicus TaxID=543632 RepID=UPI0006919E68|nr:hypothetical protein [Actinoplanes subtropicus]